MYGIKKHKLSEDSTNASFCFSAIAQSRCHIIGNGNLFAAMHRLLSVPPHLWWGGSCQYHLTVNVFKGSHAMTNQKPHFSVPNLITRVILGLLDGCAKGRVWVKILNGSCENWGIFLSTGVWLAVRKMGEMTCILALDCLGKDLSFLESKIKCVVPVDLCKATRFPVVVTVAMEPICLWFCFLVWARNPPPR